MIVLHPSEASPQSKPLLAQKLGSGCGHTQAPPWHSCPPWHTPQVAFTQPVHKIPHERLSAAQLVKGLQFGSMQFPSVEHGQPLMHAPLAVPHTTGWKHDTCEPQSLPRRLQFCRTQVHSLLMHVSGATHVFGQESELHELTLVPQLFGPHVSVAHSHTLLTHDSSVVKHPPQSRVFPQALVITPHFPTHSEAGTSSHRHVWLPFGEHERSWDAGHDPAVHSHMLFRHTWNWSHGLLFNTSQF